MSSLRSSSIGFLLLTVPFLGAFAACSSEAPPSPARTTARSTVEQLAARSVKGPRGRSRPVLGASTGELRRGALGIAPATTGAFSATLPLSADGAAELLTTAGLGVRVQLARAKSAPAEIVGGHVAYARALDEGDLVFRVRDDGIEDHVILPARPREGSVSYRVSLVGVAGLRLVEDTLELLDAGGAPRLRMEPPHVVDADDHATMARVSLHDCDADRSPRAPWGRSVTPPGGAVCTVTVSLPEGLRYPAVLDPAWTITPSMAVGRFNHVLTRLPDGKVLVAGGVGTLEFPKSAELFDPITRTWAATSSTAAQHGGTGGVLLNDGRVFIPGGEGDAGGLATCEIYDPKTGTFSPAKDILGPRSDPGLTLLKDGRVMLTGGCVMPSNGACLSLSSATAIYDPSADAWALTKKMSTQRLGHIAALLPTGEVIAAGGSDSNDYLNSSEVYDVGADSWSPTTTFGGKRTGSAWVQFPDGKLAVVGGYDGAQLSSTVTYDPASKAWVLGPSLLEARAGAALMLFGNGTLVVAGGYRGFADGGFTKSSETLLPGGLWTAGAPFSVARSIPGVARLDPSTWLVAGGLTPGNEAVGTTEILAFVAPGQACKLPTDCVSGSCSGGVCCDTACADPCMSCKASEKGSGADGVCGPIVVGTDPKDACADGGTACGKTGACDGKGQCAFHVAGKACSAAACSGGVLMQNACDGQGTCGPGPTTSCLPYLCKDGVTCATFCNADTDCANGLKCGPGGTCSGGKPKGSTCTEGKACESGFCVDGVCCGTECKGQCETCDSGGACVIVKGAPRTGRPACKGDGACAGACDGVTGAVCSYPGSVASCGSSCASGKEIPSKCDGSGICKMEGAKDCAPYVCGAMTCKTTCTTSDECASGYTCTSGACTPKSGATCSDDGLSLMAVDGSKKSCAPFRCDKKAGACLVLCSSSLDCADGNSCTSERACTPPKPADAGDGGGCGCAIPGSSDRGSRGALGLALLGLALLRRRSAPRIDDLR